MNEDFSISIKEFDEYSVLSIFGDFVARNLIQIRQAIQDALQNRNNHLFLDISRVEKIDSTGIGIIINTARHLMESEKKLKLINPSLDIVELLEMAIVDIHDSVENAKKALSLI
ncbi:MAG: STAS domain-containing protein [bacterium]